MAKTRRPARMGRSSETWQVGAARLPQWITRRDGEVGRAWMAVCVRWGPNPFVLSEPGPEEAVPGLVEGVVSQALRRWRVRPRRVQIPDPAWAPALESMLAPQGVAVEVEADLPLLQEILEILPQRMAEQDPRPGALAGAGVTLDQLAALARAAAGFMAASGWRHLNDEDLIRIEAPEVGAELRFCALSHTGGGSAPHLTFFSNPDAFEASFDEDEEAEDWDDEPEDLDEDDFLEAGEADFAAEEETWGLGLWDVELLPPWAAPFEDVELWQSHGLPWAGEGFLPVPMLADRGALHRPDHRQLAFFEGLFAALAATTEEDLDAGRWEKPVSTAEGEIRFVLSLPGLLEPPAEPAPAPGPVSVMRELERSLRRMREEPAEEESPQDRAENLLELAYQARGRRKVLLARQALEVWPDCADAYSFLARRAPDLDSAARLYELGMAAGERAMGSGAFDDAGSFWGILETRPYMRARFGLADVRVAQGRLAEAVEHFQEILRLNPNDNQGARYTLVNLLIELGRDEEARKLADAYPDDGALLRFPFALLLFRRDGDSLEARKALKQAVQINRFVPGVLLGDLRPLPRGDFYSPFGEDEAGVYLSLARGTWEDTEGALDWLRKRTTPPPRPAKRKGKKGKGKKKPRR